MSNTPSDVVTRLADAVRGNDAEAAANTYAEDVILVDPKFDTVGRAAVLEALRYWFNAFEVQSLDVVETITEGSRIAVHWKWTAVHKGEYLGVPASNQVFSGWNAIFLDTRDGMISRDLSIWDCTQLIALQELAAGSEQT